MIEVITRNAVSIADLYNQYIADLKTVFSDFETEEVENESFTVYITKSKNVKFFVTKLSAGGVVIEEYCNDDSRRITWTGSYAFASYRMVKSEFGIAMSSTIDTTNVSDAQSDWKRLSWFIGEGINTDTNEPCTGLVTTENQYSGDGRHSLFVATDLHHRIEKIDAAVSLFQGSSAAIPVLTNMFSYMYPFEFDDVYIKLQSQAQYGKLLIENEKFISGTDFCLKYTD